MATLLYFTLRYFILSNSCSPPKKLLCRVKGGLDYERLKVRNLYLAGQARIRECTGSYNLFRLVRSLVRYRCGREVVEGSV